MPLRRGGPDSSPREDLSRMWPLLWADGSLQLPAELHFDTSRSPFDGLGKQKMKQVPKTQRPHLRLHCRPVLGDEKMQLRAEDDRSGHSYMPENRRRYHQTSYKLKPRPSNLIVIQVSGVLPIQVLLTFSTYPGSNTLKPIATIPDLIREA